MANETILKYLSDQNRPFSANDVFENLHKQFGKTDVQKTLDKLVSQNKVFEKTYNKQKVYCVEQENDSGKTSDAMEDELRNLDKAISDLGESLAGSEDKLKKNEAELKVLLNTLTTDEAKEEKDKLEEQIEALKEKLDKISGGPNGNKPAAISQEEKDKAMKENEKMVKEYRKRKRICLNIIDSIMEGYPKTKKNLVEEVGIETDEDVGFKLE